MRQRPERRRAAEAATTETLIQTWSTHRIVLQDEAVSEADTAASSATTQDMKSTVPQGAVTRGSMLLERPNRLVMLAGPTPGAEYPMNDERTTIGRAEDCTISVNHNSVSRLHCEVHLLGEGRYEVVDKGSSNGVRVNGSDLRRSIIEPGDILELGDVRFRFVGAGQIFLPGVGESQQLETIPDRPPASLRPAAAGTSSLVPFVIVGAVVAVGVVVGFAWMQRQQAQPVADTPRTTAADDPEQIELQAAKKLCDNDKCDLAHDKLSVKIDAKSPLRQSSDFQNVMTRWADGQMAKAEREMDPTKKRSLLREVATDEGVPDARRKVANAKIAELDAATAGTATNIVPPPTHTAVAPPPTNTNVPTATTTAVPTAPTATHTAHPTGGGGNVFATASTLATNGDLAGARALLEPRVFGGRANGDEVKLLQGICKTQHDKMCTTAIASKYP